LQEFVYKEAESSPGEEWYESLGTKDKNNVEMFEGDLINGKIGDGNEEVYGHVFKHYKRT